VVNAYNSVGNTCTCAYHFVSLDYYGLANTSWSLASAGFSLTFGLNSLGFY